MIVLAIDTCDSRGSVAVLRDGAVLQAAAHESAADYSLWLLPAVAGVLGEAGLAMADVDGYAVTAGPGSFTGVRVGLTTVKAWAEVYGKRIAAVSRLEALAVQARADNPFVAAFVDAQREQVFGAVYIRNGAGRDGLRRVGEEMVIPPGKFVERAADLSKGANIAWVSMDAEHVLREEAWKEREKRNERVEAVSSVLAPVIGVLGAAELAAGRFTDALALDANYLRRSDAEIFWKDATHGR